MSLSNPGTDSVHPCTRWMEWGGGDGVLKYYDRDDKKTVVIGKKFRFLLLDTLATVTGYHERSSSNITSNEVRDTRYEPLVVKSFKGGELAKGYYADIKDQIKPQGAKFTWNLYVAYKDGPELRIGSIKLNGAAGGAWGEFAKANRNALSKNAVEINGSKSGKKGKVEFETPIFQLTAISPETIDEAVDLDRTLQEYLNIYLAKNKGEQVKDNEYNQDRSQFDSNRREATEFDRNENEARPSIADDWDLDTNGSEVPF